MEVNVLVLNVSLEEGMAGSMRVRNLVDPLVEAGSITLSNLALTHINEKNKIGKQGIIDNIKYLYIGYHNPAYLNQVYTFYKAGTRFLISQYKIDSKNILYNYGYPDIKNIFFILYARSLGYKIVFDIVEDNRVAKNFSGFMGKMKSKSSLYFIDKIKTMANAVIVISSYLKDLMTTATQQQLPVYEIPITVNFKHFPPTPPAYKRTDIKIFYGGSFNLTKDGIDYLITAFKEVSRQYPNISLILSGTSTMKQEMDKVMDMIKGDDKIIYKGYLSVEEYYKVLNQCDIFCMPRNNSPFAHAGFPFKLGEFLAAGKATIATNVGNINDYLTDKKDVILVEPESAEAIKNAIINCIQNPQLVQDIGIEARRTAHRFFDSDVLSKSLLNIFESI